MLNSPKRPSCWKLADEGTVWFAVLQRARRTGERSLARQARLALTQLGIHVSYRNHRPSDQTGCTAEGIDHPRRGT